MRSPELIIFDCDGVLVDSEVIGCRTVSACLSDVGIMMSPEEVFIRYSGINCTTIIKDIEERRLISLPPTFLQQLQQRLTEAFEEGLVPISGIESALINLQSKFCVASNSAPEWVRHSLSIAGLLHYFDGRIFGATHVTRGKPAPDLFLFAASQMGVSANGCLVIEDSVPGVIAARAAEMCVLGFLGATRLQASSDAKDLLLSAGANATFSEMRELPGLVGVHPVGEPRG